MVARLLLLLALSFLPGISQAQTVDAVKALGEIVIIDRDGNERPLSTFAGKAVFVNIWAYWCPPCIREMPSIVRLRDKMKNDNVEFIQLSLPQNWDKDLAWAKQKGIDLPYNVKKEPAAWRADQKAVLWNATQPHHKIWWPTTFVLDTAGRPVFIQGWKQEWDSDEWVAKIRAASVPSSAASAK